MAIGWSCEPVDASPGGLYANAELPVDIVSIINYKRPMISFADDRG